MKDTNEIDIIKLCFYLGAIESLGHRYQELWNCLHHCSIQLILKGLSIHSVLADVIDIAKACMDEFENISLEDLFSYQCAFLW